jgi:choline kinase
MTVTQAVLAIGGRGTRLRRDVEVPISKSFIRVQGRPLLYWNLKSLHGAGITRVLLCADHPKQQTAAERVFSLLKADRIVFAEAKFFRDPGLGVHGLPYQVISKHPGLLDYAFIFECGHSLMRPDHYSALISEKTESSIVFSAFNPHPSNYRQPVSLNGREVRLLSAQAAGCHALAHPILADREYAQRLPSLRFEVRHIIAYYAMDSRLKYVVSTMPPEFDVTEEWRAAIPEYERYLNDPAKLTPPWAPAQATVRGLGPCITSLAAASR